MTKNRIFKTAHINQVRKARNVYEAFEVAYNDCGIRDRAGVFDLVRQAGHKLTAKAMLAYAEAEGPRRPGDRSPLVVPPWE